MRPVIYHVLVLDGRSWDVQNNAVNTVSIVVGHENVGSPTPNRSSDVDSREFNTCAVHVYVERRRVHARTIIDVGSAVVVVCVRIRATEDVALVDIARIA